MKFFFDSMLLVKEGRMMFVAARNPCRLADKIVHLRFNNRKK